MADIADFSATELRGAIVSRAISPLEAVDAAYARIEAGGKLNAFMALCRDRARQEARLAEKTPRDDQGPLHGIPFSVKDLTNTAEVATTQGSALFAHVIPQADAVAVARARAAGAVLIGKTTTPEFGHKAFTEGPAFGRTLNPWNPAFTCGGSSGGAAVAAAAGMGPLALGTDGGGSIRIPASCCGVVGLKATLGVIPNLQAPDLFSANSYVGPIGRSVADVRMMFEVLAGPDRRDPYGQSQPTLPAGTARPLKLAWLPACGNIVDPEVAACTKAAVRKLEEFGWAIEPIELDFVALEAPFLVLLRSMLLARLGRFVTQEPERLDPTLIATIEAGRAYSATDLAEAQFARTACFAKVQAVFEDFDLIVSPTLSAPPLPCGLDPLGRIQIDGRDAGAIRGAWYPYTYPFNLTGHPALSLPCGLSRDGLPIGLQLVARWHDDRRLLDVAGRLEEALGFDRAARPVHD